MWRRQLNLFWILVALTLAIGCLRGGIQTDYKVIKLTYDTLKGFQTGYIASKAAIEEAGSLLTKDERRKINEGSKAFLVAYKSAQKALKIYHDVGSTSAELQAQKAFNDVMDALLEFNIMLTPYLNKTKGG